LPKKIRVYELARELGLTNKEALDLCLALGIGVKSHSSSIEDQQADRVRRKADREGLRRDTQPEEAAEPPKEAPETAARAGRALAEVGAAAGAPAVAPEIILDAADMVVGRPSAEVPLVRPGQEPVHAPAATGPGAEAPAAKVAETVQPAPPARPAEGTTRPVDSRLITSRPEHVVAPPPRPARQDETAPAGPGRRSESPGRAANGGARPETPARPAPIPPAPAPPLAAAASAGQVAPAPAPSRPRGPATGPGGNGPVGPGGGPPTLAGQGSPAPSTGARRSESPAPGRAAPAPGGPPLSPSGKPIPPPPGARGGRPPLSPSGKPIPPPPGLGGRGPAAAAPRPGPGAGRPGGGAGPRPTPGGGAGRPGGFAGRPSTGGGAGAGFSRPGGGGGFAGRPGGSPGGGPGGPGGPGGGRGGPAFGGRGRPPQRRAKRRRRNFEELEAQELTRYTPSDAAVPEGEVIIERGSTAQDVGPKLNRSAADVVRFLLQQGEMVTATQSLGDDMIELFAAELGASIRMVDAGEEKEAELQAKYFDDDEEEDEEALRPRPPVITVMGHVDHGKTLLLDRIRQTNVVAGEAGGITQHIGAYQVDYQGHLITFIDTPGHEAFTAMRARGAEATDIVVLVVAADDGVMPQTAEAIDHARAADVPIVVAINKVDRDNADPTRVMQQLSDRGLQPEQWGGDTITVEISALQNLGIDDLLEQLLVVAELEELRANPEGPARGIVLEANLDVGRGPVATVIVEHGTLRVGDAVVAGAAWGRVRALIDDKGDAVKEALPSTPVQVLGFDDVPAAGDEFRVTAKEKTARDIAELREQRYRSADLRKTSSATGAGAKLEDIFEQIQRGETATLNLVLKADVQGSLEAVTESLRKLERDEVKLSFIRRAVGGITENDVQLAATSNATIIGFNVRPDRKSRDVAEAHDVEIRTYEIIYKLLEDIESAMVGMLTPEYEEVITGEAEVREVFRIPRVGAVAGCYVQSGVITRGSKVRFLREGVIIWKGSITSLKRFKEDAREVAAGFECGIGLSNNQDLRQGDVIETFEEREIPRT
jgi:translation initiation factor IF-2